MTGGQIANVDLIKQVNSAAVYRLIDLQGAHLAGQNCRVESAGPGQRDQDNPATDRAWPDQGDLAASLHRRTARHLLTTIKHRFQFVSAKLGRGYLQLALYDLDGKGSISTSPR